ncbi:MAG: primosomal protein N' [Planctomycetes bacterium]|nr:primosomal protein N' [Planctomycetota bacterium]
MVRPVAEVAVNVPLEKLFHYEIPDSLAGRLEIGHRVLIPFGPRTTTGVCVGLPSETDVESLKPIRKVLHPDCRFDAHLLEFTRWIANYYHAGWGEVLEAALPPSIRSGKKGRLVSWVSRHREPNDILDAASECERKNAKARARLLRSLATAPIPCTRAELLKTAQATSDSMKWLVREGWATEEQRPYSPERPEIDLSGLGGRTVEELHPDQDAALKTIREAITACEFKSVLLHGVTGSGKTEVYMRALREVIATGKRGLVLVPEISLTPQTALRFTQGLEGRKVTLLHSMLTDSERTRHWRDIQSGKTQLVIGARSAVFSPIPDLGLIIVDEEHEPSYKQESSPRYNGRDAAIMRARMLNIPAVLGSATPSLETLHNARSGRYVLERMPRRITGHDLPVITTVPLEKDFYRTDGSGLISPSLDQLIRDRLKKRQQVLLFLNRRGFATYVHCVRCGFVARCTECDISLTYHRGESTLRCHYCGHVTNVPPECPDCKMPHLRRSGVGTEKLTDEMNRRYEDARIARLDRDTVSTHTAMEETLGRFARGEFDVLIGTQMVAKGHDFPSVTLVGIINADTGLHFPDFRASERTYQLITQVAGRAGRGKGKGRVVVQTFQPDHYAIRCAQQGEEEEFYRLELEAREALSYPPTGHLAKILFQGDDLDKLTTHANDAGKILKRDARGVRVLGPVPAPLSKLQGKHRVQILLKSKRRDVLHELLARLEREQRTRRGPVDRAIDVDPYSML